MTRNLMPESMTNLVEVVKSSFPGDEKLHKMFEACFTNTFNH